MFAACSNVSNASERKETVQPLPGSWPCHDWWDIARNLAGAVAGGAAASGPEHCEAARSPQIVRGGCVKPSPC